MYSFGLVVLAKMKAVLIFGILTPSSRHLIATRTLSDCREEHKVVGIEGIDTREIVKIIRDQGIMKAMITNEDKPLEV